MSPQFNNMTDLVVYLDSIEKRVLTLERENQALQDQKEVLNRHIQELGGDVQKNLPKTSLLSSNFLMRAFTVWGQYFVAHWISSIPITIVSFIVFFSLLRQGISILPTP
jgi:hypothetical protein